MIKKLTSIINSLENKTLIYSIRKGLIFTKYIITIYIFFLIRGSIKKQEIFKFLNVEPFWLYLVFFVFSIFIATILSVIIVSILVYLYMEIEFWILWNFSKKYKKRMLDSLPKKYDKKIKDYLESSRKFKSTLGSHKDGYKNKKNYQDSK